MDQKRIEIVDYYIYTDKCFPRCDICIRFRTEYHGSRYNKCYLRQIAVVDVSEGVESVLGVCANRLLKQMDRHSKFFGGEMKRLSLPNDDDIKEIEAAAENWGAGHHGGLKVIKDPAGNLLGFRLPFGATFRPKPLARPQDDPELQEMLEALRPTTRIIKNPEGTLS
jgi:hypothetical protein